MDMGGMGSMPMGGMDMGDGVPGLFYLQRMYWACLGAAIGAFAVANLLNHILRYQRFHDGSATPAKPKKILVVAYATLTAMAREVTYASLRPVSLGRKKWHLPALGQVLLALANLTILMVFCFYKLNTADQWSWENIGYRTGFMCIAQLPMIILLAGKHNWIGYLTGTSHERLNWLHRWFSRTLWLTVTIHMCFWFRSWGRYHFIVAQLKENSYARTGFASWLVLTFMLLTSSRPIRIYGYELFLPLHLCTWGGFIAAVYQHAPDEVKAWVWVPIGLFCFDRVSRMAMMVIVNTRLLRLPSRKDAAISFWANTATFTPLYGNVTKISIPSPSFKWRAGNHVLLGCHTLAPLQSHPFSIASIPADGKLEFYVQAKKGATRRFFDYANKQKACIDENSEPLSASSKFVTIEGPYGTIRDLRQFDSVVLIAGGIGATYTIPLMRDIVYGWQTACLQPRSGDSAINRKGHTNTRSIRFIWVIKSRFQLTWFEEQLRRALHDIEECRAQRPEIDINLEISIYLTCDDSLESPSESADTASETRDKYVSGVSTLPDDSESKLKIEEAGGYLPQTQPSGNQSLPEENESAPNPCSSDGCQCNHTVEDEDANEIRPCCCSGVPQSTIDKDNQQISRPLATDRRSSALIASLDEEKEPPKYTQETYPKYTEVTAISDPLPQLRILTGRPDSRSILRASLERARGESGVVVCGPPGLVVDVQCSVTALSDERAVHKGTGAQGIYFHSEGFWY